MPQARARSKGSTNKRQQNQTNGPSDTGGRAGSGKNASKFQQRGANARYQQGMQGARAQRANNQRNQNNMPAQQRERDEYGSVRGREFVNSYDTDMDQPRSSRGRQGQGGFGQQGGSTRGPSNRGGRSEQGRPNGGRGRQRSENRSGYNYQEEDFEEGGQNESTGGRGGRQNRGQSYQRSGSERGQQYDGDDFTQREHYGRREQYEDQGGYEPQSGRNYQNRDGWGERGGRGQYQYQDEGDWGRAGPGNYQGGEFQGGRSNRGRDAGYCGASQYSQGGGRGDYRDEGPNWNQRYGNVNRVPGGIEDEEFAESRQYNDRGGQRGRGQQGNGGGFENARGEYSNFNVAPRGRDDDSEMNDYTDARLGSNARRGGQSAKPRSRNQSSERGSARQSAGANKPKHKGRGVNR